jgi:elongator complex protein 1
VPELLEDVVHPALLESREQIAEDITEMKEQIRKQLVRLRELRIKKNEEPGAFSMVIFDTGLIATLTDVFYGNEDESAMHNVDVMTDVSAPATVFTRYTVAPTSASRTSRYASP